MSRIIHHCKCGAEIIGDMEKCPKCKRLGKTRIKRKQLDETQGLLRAATGIAFEWYCWYDHKSGKITEWQLMPFPWDKGNEHPFWEWYLWKKPQFYATKFEAVAMLLQWWRAWHTGHVEAAYDKNHGVFRAMYFATKRERKEWTKLVNKLAIDSIVIRDDFSPDDPHYARMQRLVKNITEFPQLLP